MVLRYSFEMDEFMPLNFEFEDTSYGNFFVDNQHQDSSSFDTKPATNDNISLLNISANSPVPDISFNNQTMINKTETNMDYLLKLIETQEKQNEKMMIQFKLKQVLLDYLKAKQSSSSAPISHCAPQQSNIINASSDVNQTSANLYLSPSEPNTPEIDAENTQFFPASDYNNLSRQTLLDPVISRDFISSSVCENTDSSEIDQSSDQERMDDSLMSPQTNAKKSSTKRCGANSSKQSQKRSAHLSAEFRYRTKLNDKITKLRNIVGPKSQLSKSGVLARAIDLINKLQKTNTKLKEDNSRMRLLLVQACNYSQISSSSNNNNSLSPRLA